MPKTIQLNTRQTAIAELIARHGPLRSSEVAVRLDAHHHASLITIKRDLALLEEQRMVAHQGRGRAVRYVATPSYALLSPIDVAQYFSRERAPSEIRTRFDPSVFSILEHAHILSPEETATLDRITSDAHRGTREMSPAIFNRELERFIIEFSWKSSRIEGNTYSLLETEALLKRHRRAKGKSEKEAKMILNHKHAFSRVQEHTREFSRISIATIEHIHTLLTRQLDIPRNIRKTAVGITGTHYRPLNNEFQIREALEKMCALVNALPNAFEKALVAMLLLAYIQPFEDGNKRTSRMIGNAILLAHHALPLSYRATEEDEYKKAVILFYEQLNAAYFKTLFLAQYRFVAENYFAVKNT